MNARSTSGQLSWHIFISLECRIFSRLSSASLRCSRCKLAYYCAQACFGVAWLEGGVCNDGALMRNDAGELVPLTWPAHRDTCCPFDGWACTACGEGSAVVQCSGPGLHADGCLDHFCNVACRFRTPCPHLIDSKQHELREAQAASGLCSCSCCDEIASIVSCALLSTDAALMTLLWMVFPSMIRTVAGNLHVIGEPTQRVQNGSSV